MLAILQNMMIEATGNNEEEATKIKVMTKQFDDFNIEALKLENSYNVSESIAEAHLYGHIQIQQLFPHVCFPSRFKHSCISGPSRYKCRVIFRLVAEKPAA